MKDERKTKKQLIAELAGLRQQIAELEAAQTERKRTEEALWERDEFVTDLFESLTHLFYVIDANDYTIKMANSAARLGELSETSTCYALTHKRSKPCGHVGHRCPLEEVKKTKKPVMVEHIHYDRDGHRRVVEVHGYPILGSEGNVVQMIEYSLEVTERKLAEEALRESEERYHSLFDGIPVGINRTTPAGQYLDANPALVRMLGYPDREALLAVNAADTYANPEQRKQWQALIEREGIVPSFEVRLRRHDGTIIWAESNARAVRDADGRVVYYEGILQDITERKRAEEEIERLARFPSENANPVLRVAKDGTILYANAASMPLLNAWGCQVNQPLSDEWREFILDVLGCGSSRETEVECEDHVLSLMFAPVLGAGYVNVYGLDITERKRAEEALRRRNRELALLNRAGQALISTLDLDQILVTVLEEVCGLLGAVASSVWLVDPASDELVCQQATGPHSEVVRGWRLAPGQGIAGWVARHGESLIVPDARDDERYFRGVDQQIELKTRSILSVPLQAKEDVIGVLQVVGTEVDRFCSTDLELIESLSAPAAIAIENARLYEAERKLAAQLTVVNRVARKAVSILDPDQLLQEIITDIQQGFGYYNVILLQFDETASELGRQAIAGGFENVAPLDYRQRMGEGLIGWAAETGQSLLVNDVSKDPRYIVGFQEEVPTRSELCVPLKLSDRVIGVLDVQEPQLDAFDETDLTAMETLADQIAAAIENARLYQQVRQDAETKATLLDEVNHRVKNNLSAIIGLLYAERRLARASPRGVEEQAVYQSIMRDLTSRVQGLATVHSLLSASEWAPLSLSELTTQIIHASLQTLPYDKCISVGVTPSPVRVTSDQAHNLALVINELTTNAVKYGLHERSAARIAVRIGLDDDDAAARTVLFEYRNDGPGYPEEVLRLERHGVGFDLIQNIVRKSLRGELSLHNDHGAVTVIRFKAQA